MDALLRFFDQLAQWCQDIADAFFNILKFVLMLVEGVLWLVGALPRFLSQFAGVFAYCPSFVSVFLTCALLIIALYAIFKLL